MIRKLAIFVTLSIPMVMSAQNPTIAPASKITGSLDHSVLSYRNQLTVPLSVQRPHAVLEATSSSMQATPCSYADTSMDAIDPQSGESTVMRPTASASGLPTGGADEHPLSHFFSGSLSGKVVLRWGNSTVWNSRSYYYQFFSQTKSTGILAGMTVRNDVRSVSSDSSSNVMVALASPPDSTFAVGRFVSFWPDKPSLTRCMR